MQKIRSSEGVVGIVTSILLVALLVTVFSIIQTVYVPQWMEELESEHMDTVGAQFAQLKHTLDIQMYEPSYYSIPISSPITLGSEDVPYFLSQKSSGTLEIQNNNFEVDITGDSTESHKISTIEYVSRNSYFSDQTYIYETGAVILSQTQGTLLISRPFFSVTNEATINISFTVINITSFGGKTSAVGTTTASILTNYSSSQNTTITNTTEITITTNYENPWNNYLNTTLTNKGLTEGSDYDITQSDNEVTIDFSSAPKDVQVTFTKITMNAQIAPGWIS